MNDATGDSSSMASDKIDSNTSLETPPTDTEGIFRLRPQPPSPRSSDIASNTSLEMQPSLEEAPPSTEMEGIFRRRQQQPRSRTDRSSSSSTAMRIAVGCLLLSCMIFVVVDYSFGDRNIEAALHRFLEWVQLNPIKGALLVILCYIVATVLFVPGSILTLGSGYAIGSAFDNTAIGVLVTTGAVFIGASIGSICSFLLGRYLFRDCVYRLTESYPLFQAIDRALEGNGLKIMVLLRLSPLIPYNALDYMSGITSIPLRDYSLALIALLPGALMLSFVGASASSLSDSTSTSNMTVKIISIVSGLVFGGCGIFAVSYYSKLELDRILQAQSVSAYPSASDSADSEEGLLPAEGFR